MTKVRLTPKEQTAFAWMEQAADIRCLALMTAGKTEWAGDLWVNQRTAKSLARKGLVEIDWPPYEEDDVYLYVKEDTDE